MFHYKKSIATTLLVFLLSGCGEYESHIPPNAVASGDMTVYEGLVMLDASASSDEDSSIVKYTWKENDIIVGTQKIVTLSAGSVGTHIFTLEVEDSDGNIDTDTISVNVIAGHLVSLTGYKTVYSEETTISFSVMSDSALCERSYSYSYSDEKCYDIGYYTQKWYDQNGTILSTEKTLELKNMERGKSYPITLKVTDLNNNVDIEHITIMRGIVVDIGKDRTMYKGNSVLKNLIDETTIRYNWQENNETTISYNWQENNETISDKEQLSLSDLSIGKHQLTLEVKDSYGNIDKDTATITLLDKDLVSLEDKEVFLPTTTLSFSNLDSEQNITTIGWYDANETLLSTQSSFELQGLQKEQSYPITLKVTDENGYEDIEQMILKRVMLADAGEDKTFYNNSDIVLDNVASIDENRTIANYKWKENNVIVGTQKLLVLTNLSVGNHQFTLEVEDTDGNIDTDEVNVYILKKIQASDVESSDYFGSSVAIDGDYIVVGARYADTTSNTTGSAYIFKRSDNNISQIAKIQASDAENYDNFGHSVAIDGDYIVVGAYGDDTYRGSVYIFKRNDNNISQIAKIQASDAESYNYFGHSVAIDGDYIVVGAYGNDIYGGSVYIFKRNDNNNISQIAKIQASDAESFDYFGHSVAIDGDYIVVGAYSDDTTHTAYYTTDYTDAGSAYIFKRNDNNNISQIAKIQASDAGSYDNFGYSVAIDEDYIVVGSYKDDKILNSIGSAYIFKRSDDNNISQIAKIQASDAENYDNFGYSVAIDGDYIVVGSYKDDKTSTNIGRAYIFKRSDDNNISQIVKIQASDAKSYDYFGSSVAIDGNTTIFGAIDKNSVYIMENVDK